MTETMNARIFYLQNFLKHAGVIVVSPSPPYFVQHIINLTTERLARKAAKVTGPRRTRNIPRRSPRIKAALRNNRQKAIKGVRYFARIAAKMAMSS